MGTPGSARLGVKALLYVRSLNTQPGKVGLVLSLFSDGDTGV